MKRWIKITIIVVLFMAVAGIYYGKNVYFKKGNEQPTLTNNLDKIIAVEKGEVKKPIVMELATTICPTCIQMYTVMESIDKKYKDKLITGVVYLDDSNIQEKAVEYAEKYSIRVVPTMIFLDEKGELFLRQEGYMSEEEVTEVLKSMGVQ